MISSRSFYKHATLHHRISAKRSFGFLKIYFTFCPELSCLVLIQRTSPTIDYRPTASFLLIFFHTWIISRLLLLLSNVVSTHFSTYLHSFGTQNKVPLSRCLEGCCINIQLN